jgi:hypothetical protein
VQQAHAGLHVAASPGREDANPVVHPSVEGCTGNVASLRLVHRSPPCPEGQIVGIMEDGQRVAAGQLVGEDIDLGEAVLESSQVAGVTIGEAVSSSQA